MLYPIYHITLNLLKNHIFGVKKSRLCHLLCSVIINIITQRDYICKPLVVSPFIMAYVTSLSEVMSCEY